MSFMSIVKEFMEMLNDASHKLINSKSFQNTYREKYGEEKFAEYQDKLAKANEEYKIYKEKRKIEREKEK